MGPDEEVDKPHSTRYGQLSTPRSQAELPDYLHLGFDKPNAPPPPTGHGWTMQNSKCVPLRYTKEALPRSLDAVLNQERHEIPPDLSDTREVSDTGEEIDYDSELSDTKELD